MPYRPYLIVGLVVLAIGGFVLARSGEGDERSPEFTISPEQIDAIQAQAPQSALGLADRLLETMPTLATLTPTEPRLATIESREVDPVSTAPLGPPKPKPPAPRFVEVTLDPSGRPYDEYLQKGATVRRRPLAVLHAPSRRVLFVGGEYASYPTLRDYEPVTLAERPGRRYRVDAIWVDYRRPPYESIVGVVIVERETPVVRWREEGPGYGTDAGLGAITTYEWAAREKEYSNEVSRRYWKLLVDQGRLSFVADVDRHPGIDTIVFSNGFGDGGFPSVAGYDAEGRRAQIVLWTIAAPWRLAFADGRPPPQVTQRENELAACLASRGRIDGARCRVARR